MSGVKALQFFLQKKGIEILREELKILVKVHPEYNNLYQFKYNQIESQMSNSVVQQCRGVVLDRDQNWKVVCHIFNKFFNLHELHAALIDWNTAKVFSKEDGSLIQVFWYDGEWQMTTSGSPDGSGNVGDYGFTFRDLFWDCWNDLKYQLPENKDLSYAFELCTKYNRIVVNHDKSRIVFLGARHNEYGYELWPQHIGQFYNWEIVKQFDFGYTDEIEIALQKMDGMQQEGFVVFDGTNRVKMKCEDYVRKHRLVSSMSQRNLIDIIRQNETEELLAYFPEWEKEHDNLKIEYESLVHSIESVYNKSKNIRSQKDFARAIKTHRFSGCMFQLRNKKVSSVRDYLQKMNIKHLEQAMEKRR